MLSVHQPKLSCFREKIEQLTCQILAIPEKKEEKTENASKVFAGMTEDVRQRTIYMKIEKEKKNRVRGK